MEISTFVEGGIHQNTSISREQKEEFTRILQFDRNWRRNLPEYLHFTGTKGGVYQNTSIAPGTERGIYQNTSILRELKEGFTRIPQFRTKFALPEYISSRLPPLTAFEEGIYKNTSILQELEEKIYQKTSILQELEGGINQNTSISQELKHA